MALFKCIFYNGEIPDKIPLTVESSSYRGDIDVSTSGIRIDYFPMRTTEKLGTHVVGSNEYSVKRKTAMLAVFPIKVPIECLVVSSAAFTITFYMYSDSNFMGKYTQKVSQSASVMGVMKEYYMEPARFNEFEQELRNPRDSVVAPLSETVEHAEPAPARADGVVYSVEGVRGRHIDVYEDKCVIKTKVGFGSLLTGNATDGEKTIYYVDCIGVQFKKSGLAIGYLQLETASATMNNKKDNFFNENSFTFDVSKVSNERMEEISNYVKKRVEEYKQSSKAPTVINSAPSDADELLKFKNLLDMGVITQEEFDAKKKQILGL